MENLLLPHEEYKLVLKDKKFLESKYNVTIFLPQFVSKHDIVVATVHGGKSELIQNFIQRRLEEINRNNDQRIPVQNNVDTITLSDSDYDSTVPVLAETQQNGKKRRCRRGKKKRKRSANMALKEPIDLSSTILVDDSDESSTEDPVLKRSKVELPSSAAAFVPLKSEKENPTNLDVIGDRTNSKINVKDELPISAASFIPLDHGKRSENSNGNNGADDSVILIDAQPFEPENSANFNIIGGTSSSTIQVKGESSISSSFIPLNHRGINRNSNHNEVHDPIMWIDSQPSAVDFSSSENKNNVSNEVDDSVIILDDDDEIPRPIEEPKRLRPIVIDGSNVAREHGKITNTFSCKGIKIAIDYFLKKGHAQVTAFVPQYRRHNKFGPVLTTDQPLLEELAKEQRVVFTPSRRINNKRVTCYDDRFIVQLAATTGGVILSNDNYRDLLTENEEFKKAIEERLLMFCFVGDLIMIPQDPLGRNGPSLEKFLSFPS